MRGAGTQRNEVAVVKHGQYRKAERARKSGAAQRAASGELKARGSRKRPFDDVHVDAGMPSPPWKQQVRERVLADLQALEQREEERVARGQLARERRAARALASKRCGSCATCAELIIFGAQTNWKSFSGGRPGNVW